MLITQFEEVELSGYNEPIILTAKEVSAIDSITGIWYGIHYLKHDCRGCETKNRIWLSISNDFNVIMIEAIDVFDYLFQIPIINKSYGKSIPWLVQATNFKGRGDCLVEMALDPTDEFASDQFLEFYGDLNCELKPGDFPVEAFKYYREGEKLSLHFNN